MIEVFQRLIPSDAKGFFSLSLGLSHLSAALSWHSQSALLIGSQGIQPIHDLSLIWPNLSLFVLSKSDLMLSSVGWLWILSAVALTLNHLPKASLLICLVSAVSISQVAQPFLPFQWDILLHEASLLGLLYLPLLTGRATSYVSEVGRWALKLLLFKLIWDSGVAKVLGADPLWHSLKALYLHFWTQPLPHLGAEIATQLPEWILRLGAYLTIAIELWIPWLLFLRIRHPMPLWLLLFLLSLIGTALGQAPHLTSIDTIVWCLCALMLDERLHSKWRIYLPRLPLGPKLLSPWSAVVPISILMILISLTGSYGFFQLLTLSLCIPLFDQGMYGDAPTPYRVWQHRWAWMCVSLWISISLMLHLPWAPKSLTQVTSMRSAYQWVVSEVSPLQLVTRYGLFARMTTQRSELIIEGSQEGEIWSAYLLPYQVNGASTAPPIAGLHMPRLDWMLWFEALNPNCQEGWFLDLLEAIFEGKAPILNYLSSTHGDPLIPPKLIRVRRVNYRPATLEFWNAKNIGFYCPTVSYKELKRVRAHIKG